MILIKIQTATEETKIEAYDDDVIEARWIGPWLSSDPQVLVIKRTGPDGQDPDRHYQNVIKFSMEQVQ